MLQKSKIKQFFENELTLGKEQINALGSELKDIMNENSIFDDVTKHGQFFQQELNACDYELVQVSLQLKKVPAQNSTLDREIFEIE